MSLTISLMLFAGGALFGWATNNFLYPPDGCNSCIVAFIRGRKCPDCPKEWK